MTMETDLVALLRTHCPRVHADVAPLGTARPYVTWQAIGGDPLYYIEGAPADKRNTIVLVSVWADTRPAATTLMQQIEAAVMVAGVFTARVTSEAISLVETDVEPWQYGSQQDFTILASR